LQRAWPIRRVVGAALLAAFASVLPLVGIVFYRLEQTRSRAPVWARLAEASRWLSVGAVCNGAASADQAKDDLTRWRAAVKGLREQRGWIDGQALAAHLSSFDMELERTMSQDASSWAPWVSGRCHEAQMLADQALERAVQLGLDPSSRAERFEDLALRDVTTYLAVWVGFCGLLFAGVQRRVTRPTAELERVLSRIAEGDLSATLPDGGAVPELTGALRRAVQRFEQRDRLKLSRLAEQRTVIRRMVELMEQPVLIAGVDHKLDFANAAAGRAFGEAGDSLEGVDLKLLPGGEALQALMDDIIRVGDATGESLLPDAKHLARCAVVRDDRGAPSRVILVLRDAEGAWWRKLWKA
jgi:HAMP domain-containing protein